jgi:hypothetical protein
LAQKNGLKTKIKIWLLNNKKSQTKKEAKPKTTKSKTKSKATSESTVRIFGTSTEAHITEKLQSQLVNTNVRDSSEEEEDSEPERADLAKIEKESKLALQKPIQRVSDKVELHSTVDKSVKRFSTVFNKRVNGHFCRNSLQILGTI